MFVAVLWKCLFSTSFLILALVCLTLAYIMSVDERKTYYIKHAGINNSVELWSSVRVRREDLG